MTEYLVCHWHICQNDPEPGAMYCAAHGRLEARQREVANAIPIDAVDQMNRGTPFVFPVKP
jgi:hypothetical protein